MNSGADLTKEILLAILVERAPESFSVAQLYSLIQKAEADAQGRAEAQVEVAA
ncbi:MAG: hypothetical protein ACJ8R9_21855 [Steroidobacteraceae bacterium]